MNHPSTEVIQARPGPWLKLIFKAPAYLYRLHLGWLLGHRFLMVSHRGRKTGKVRHTVLEVVRYSPASKESIVPSSYGEKADWYQNLQAAPGLKIRTGFERYAPEQRILETSEVYRVLADYAHRHPTAMRVISKRMLGLQYDGSESQRQMLASHLRMVAFWPRAGRVKQNEQWLDELL